MQKYLIIIFFLDCDVFDSFLFFCDIFSMPVVKANFSVFLPPHFTLRLISQCVFQFLFQFLQDNTSKVGAVNVIYCHFNRIESCSLIRRRFN